MLQIFRNRRSSLQTWLSIKIFKNLAENFESRPINFSIFLPKYLKGPKLKIRPHSCPCIDSSWKSKRNILKNVRDISVYNLVWSIVGSCWTQYCSWSPPSCGSPASPPAAIIAQIDSHYFPHFPSHFSSTGNLTLYNSSIMLPVFKV